MKSKFRYTVMGACLMLLIGAQSCDLEEYNPHGTTSDEVFSVEEGMNMLINSAYVNWGSQFYGREDIVMLTEGGTDLWINIANSGYGRQMTKYEDLSANQGQIKNTWNRLYEIINYCNAGINRIESVQYKESKEKESRIGELYFLRAFTYWHLVEQYGNVDLRLKETQTGFFSCYRSPMSDFYTQMLSDINMAIDNLPVDPYPITDIGRATKKAAYGLKARLALTRVAYETNDSEKKKYYEMARDAAKYVIDNANTLKVKLYNNFADVFNPANNKINEEAMFVVTHSTNASLNPQAKNPSRLHMWFKAKYSSKAGMLQDLNYGNDGNAKSGSFALMPTRFLLELFDESKDARYAASFREEYYQNNEDYKWTETDLTAFEKPVLMAGQAIKKGDLALLYTKKKIADKRNKPYAVVDIDDTYNADGTVSKNAFFNICYPSLIKYEDPDLPTSNSQVGTKDVILMRLSEMYLIAAEAELALGNKKEAADYVNVIRKRAALPGKEEAMKVSEADLSQAFILDERARELCGEHIRWFDLKRTGTLISRVKAYNKDIPLIQQYHALRPIPEMFLAGILNREEFKQNPEY